MVNVMEEEQEPVFDKSKMFNANKPDVPVLKKNLSKVQPLPAPIEVHKN